MLRNQRPFFRASRAIGVHLTRLILASSIAAMAGCEQPKPGESKARPAPLAEPDRSNPVEQSEFAETTRRQETAEPAQRPQETSQEHSASPDQAASEPPKVPASTAPLVAPKWLAIHDSFHVDEGQSWTAEWTGQNRFEVTTDNVHRLTIDFRRIPEGAPRRGPWNLQLDGQGIEITGFRGNVVDLVRSKNGDWTVDRTRRMMDR